MTRLAQSVGVSSPLSALKLSAFSTQMGTDSNPPIAKEATP